MPDFNDSPSIAAAVEAAKANGEITQEQPTTEPVSEAASVPDQPVVQEEDPVKALSEEV